MRHIWQETTTLFTYSNFVTLGYMGYKGYIFQNSIALIEILIFCIYFYTTLVLLYENYFKLLLCWKNSSHVTRKQTFCLCENTSADQLGNCEANHFLCFCYTDRTISLLFKSKIYKIHPSYVLVPLGLCWTYIVGFLMVRLIYWLLLSKICVYRQWIK